MLQAGLNRSIVRGNPSGLGYQDEAAWKVENGANGSVCGCRAHLVEGQVIGGTAGKARGLRARALNEKIYEGYADNERLFRLNRLGAQSLVPPYILSRLVGFVASWSCGWGVVG